MNQGKNMTALPASSSGKLTAVTPLKWEGLAILNHGAQG